MKFYKLSMDMERENDIVCHYENDYGIQQNMLVIGEKIECWDARFVFYYIKEEGGVWTDYLANDKGWFLVSCKLKQLLESLNTEIQFLPVKIREKNEKKEFEGYYIANILRIVDALCLDKSKYFETEVESIGTVQVVSKYAIYGKKTEGADIFKLANGHEIPIFVSGKFKKMMEKNNITGISLTEIKVE